MAVFLLEKFSGIDESQGTANAQPDVAAASHNIDTDLGRLAVAQGYTAALPPIPGGAMLRRVMRFDQRTEDGATTHILAATDAQVWVWFPDGDPVWTVDDSGEDPEHDEDAEPGEKEPDPNEEDPGEARDESPHWHLLYDGALSGEWSYVVWEQNMKDIMILANGADPVKKWYGDTNALEDLGGLPSVDGEPARFKYLALHKERLWGAGWAVEPDSVFYSRNWDPENWSGDPLTPIKGGGYMSIPQHDGAKINGLKNVFGDILIFRANKAIRIYGDNPDNYQIVNVRGSYGPVSNESVADAGSICWFWTADGLGYYDGMSTGLVDDRKIGSIIARVSPAAFLAVNGMMKGNHLYIALPLDGAEECNAVLEYDTARQTYMLHEGIAAQDFVFSTVARETLYIAVGDEVCVYGGEALGNAPISARWISPWFDLGNKASVKSITRIQAYGTLRKPGGTADDTAAILFTVRTDRGVVAKRFALRNGRSERFAVSMLLSGTRFRVEVESVYGSIFMIEGGIELEVTAKRGAF